MVFRYPNSLAHYDKLPEKQRTIFKPSKFRTSVIHIWITFVCKFNYSSFWCNRGIRINRNYLRIIITRIPRNQVSRLYANCHTTELQLIAQSKAYSDEIEMVLMTGENYVYRKNSKSWDTSNNCHNCPKIGKV